MKIKKNNRLILIAFFDMFIKSIRFDKLYPKKNACFFATSYAVNVSCNFNKNKKMFHRRDFK